ncbi:hypothetical protein Desde_0019 [Desulfitobacterium dehalogenans ATCC 51507]|uniref:DUF4179 domain-containing protein n=1 Tax=Desulfitobacterium dehalogenans (strain ATCC 51507 / DSM 9161 / JW/IU-DC1) TaxID=756499 RepID=I4A3I2_DESDJ|nr:DUF4179 domain-containing protein [Desulfitobacterium dehalogenans]AFL98516.1 hypothetical protein Desde_0019 [Desulfitobacterium dehalogenans ATCC 51507]
MTIKNEKSNVDLLLRKALTSPEKPTPELIQKVKSQYVKEEPVLRKSTIRRSFSTVAAAAMALVIFATTAFAASYFLKPSDVANQLGDKTLSAAFDSPTAVNINQSITSGDYTFTLLGLVSGKDITDNPAYNSNGDILGDRTYTVVAIQKKDGSPMPTAQDENYPTFYVSPYIKGLKPWQVNAHTLNGGYIENVVDGVMYRIIDCDEVAMFADRGLYLGVNTGSFYNSEAFNYDENTGMLTADPDFDGASVVFDLPIDKSMANPEKAQTYLDEVLGEFITNAPIVNNSKSEVKAGTKHVMSYGEYKAWADKKLDEMKALVEQGKYSKSAMELDRRGFDSNLKDIKNGGTLTLIEHVDGSYETSISSPVEGYDVTVGDDGGIFIERD